MENIIKTMSKLLKFMIKALTKVTEKGKKVVNLYEEAKPKVAKIIEIITTIEEIINTLETKKVELEGLKS